jgi:O-antigen/teichoic acid export membrane protein
VKESRNIMPAYVSLTALVSNRAFTQLVITGLRGATLLAKISLTLFVARFIGLDALGTYGLIAGSAIVIPVITSLGLMGGLSRNAVTQNLTEVTSALRRYWLFQGAIYGTALLGALASAGVFEHWPFAVAVVVIVALEQINDGLFILLNNLRYPLLANGLMFIRSAGWISAFVALSFQYPSLRNLAALLLFWIGGSVTTLACFAYATRDWPWTKSAPRVGQRRWLVHLFRQSRVLYVNNIANVAGQYLDRYLIGAFLGLELTGVYVLFWSIGNALSNLISTSTIQTALPNLITAHMQQDPMYWGLFRRTLTETLVGAVTLAVAAGALVHAARHYLDRPLAIQWLPALWLILVGFVLRMVYEVQGAVFYSRQQDKLTFASGLLVLGTSMAANLMLLPLLSLYGSAIAVAASYGAGLIARHGLMRKYGK